MSSTASIGAGPLETGSTGSLSPWAAPYVTGMLGKGQALANQDYQGYTGPLTSGPSTSQQAAFQGIAGLAVPTTDMGAYQPQQFTAGAAQEYANPYLEAAPMGDTTPFQPSQFTAADAQSYMNPYLEAGLQPQIVEAQRQAEMQRLQDAGRLTNAGAYGGSRQAIMESEGNRNLAQNLSDITGTGYRDAYNLAQNQFNVDQDRFQGAQNDQRQYGLQALANQQGQFNTDQSRWQSAQGDANSYGLQALQAQANLGQQERAIEQAGMTADLAQFEEERDFPYKQAQYQQSLLQGLPIAAQNISYQDESDLSKLLGVGGGLASIWETIFG